MSNQQSSIMKNPVSLLAILCLLILTCCQQGTKLPENYQDRVCEELSKLGAKYFEAWDNEDLEACMSFYDKDFVNMFSFGSVSNLEQCRESYKNMFENFIIEGVKYERSECFADHNFAFEVGTLEQTLISNNKEDTVISKVRGMSVYKKQEDGSWKQFRLFAQQ